MHQTSPGMQKDHELLGLSEIEAQRRLEQFGRNEIPESQRNHPLLELLSKFWGPIPWMLEATILLQVLLGKGGEAAIIAVLLGVNAGISFVEEGRASKALELLRHRLTAKARVLRDGVWRSLLRPSLVPGDVVHLRMGDLSPADVRIIEGDVLLDQSALTGESVAVEAGAGAMAYAAAIVRRGEATGEVTATGQRTYFGKTAELVRTAASTSHLAVTIFKIVRILIAIDAVLIAALLVYAAWADLPLRDVLPFALILLVASVPVALPATFTLATALGAAELARSGVLLTRLSAIEEAAGMDVLCTDKTGTITENRLTLAAMQRFAADVRRRTAAARRAGLRPGHPGSDRPRHSERGGRARSARRPAAPDRVRSVRSGEPLFARLLPAARRRTLGRQRGAAGRLRADRARRLTPRLRSLGSRLPERASSPWPTATAGRACASPAWSRSKIRRAPIPQRW